MMLIYNYLVLHIVGADSFFRYHFLLTCQHSNFMSILGQTYSCLCAEDTGSDQELPSFHKRFI
jgi:hypothetical protein